MKSSSTVTPLKPDLFDLNLVPALPETLPVAEQSPNPWYQRLRTNYAIFALILLTLLTRLLTMPTFIESRDGLFFVRGLERYAVAEMRPHWPGYPVYLWFAKLCQLMLQSDPVQAFHVLAALASSFSIWPIAALSRDWRRSSGGSEREGQLAGFGAGLLWAVVPLSWIGGTEIFSDPLALLLGLLMLWACWQALELKKSQPDNLSSRWWLLGAAILAGLMLGVRLSYLALLLPIAFVTLKFVKDKVKLGIFSIWFPLLVGLGLAVPMVWWLGWQLMMEGSNFIKAGLNHLAGHYDEWGGSITTDHQVLTRPARLLETIVVYGVGGWWPGAPWLRLFATLGVAGLLLIGAARLFKASSRTPRILIGLWLLPYGLWILLGNDVDLARYDFPFIALFCMVAGLGLPIATRFKYAGLVALLGVVVTIGAANLPLELEHHTRLPIGPELAQYANQNLNPRQSEILIADDVSPLIFFNLYQAPTFQSGRVSSANLAAQVQNFENQKRTVYLTTSTPPTAFSSDWVPVARLCRSQYLESRGPLEVWIYQHTTVGTPHSPLTLPKCY